MVKHLINIGGSSTGLILDRAILQLLGLEQGSAVELSIDSANRILTLRPAAAEDESARREKFRAAQKGVRTRHAAAFRKLAKR